ncbi:MAG: sulfite exporter TauE/SafE family protein [Chloroflexi bacterium]|nr:sulfite exporter TauE/SafE family protein [Chloroflexota bacterium]
MDPRVLVLQWYSFLAGFNGAVTEPLTALSDSIGVPIVAALLLGLLGATSPCQLTTNASALAFVSRRLEGPVPSALAYLLGKALVYTAVGVAVLLTGQQLAQSSIPFIVFARKVLGPLMIVIGLVFLGVLRAPSWLAMGHGVSEWLEERAGGGLRGSFLLGTAFAFAFCPTLFLLFFGLTIPLALQSSMGVLYPPAFALGTTLPLLALAGLLAFGTSGLGGSLHSLGRTNRVLERIAGVVLVLAGLNDTFVYWFL